MNAFSIILPIKPEYVEQIVTGKKKYEYRKIKCERKIEKIYLYSTYPVQTIIAEVEVIDVLYGTPKSIWTQTQKAAGITKKQFFEYYSDTNSAIAFKLGDVIRYDRPKKLSEFGIEYVPRSFVYV